MKKTLITMLVLAAGLTLSSCGANDEVKVINKDTEQTAETDAAAEESGSASDEAPASGYSYSAGYNDKTIAISMDMDMSEVLSSLGDSETYFEAASCAFNGLDKIYTYDHFEVDTYPNDDKDLVSGVVLLDDITSTAEGAYIGQSLSDIEEIYGTGYETDGDSYIYTKGNSHLEFVCADDTVISIAYTSTVLD